MAEADQSVPEPAGETAASAAPTASITAPDGYSLACRHYPAVGKRRGVLVCIHGIQSHGGWYVASCQQFAKAGYEVFFVDRRGSGLNLQDRGFCRSPAQLEGDLAFVLEHFRQKFPGDRLFLLAISWGSKLAAVTLASRPSLADGVIYVCPGWFAKISPTFREQLSIGWSTLFWPRRRFTIPLSDPALFTDSPEWQQYMKTDSLSLHVGTARLLAVSKMLDAKLLLVPETHTMPALLLLAGQDRIIDNDRVKAFFEKLATRDKTQREYPAAHHTLEFEPNATEIFADVIKWLDNHL